MPLSDDQRHYLKVKAAYLYYMEDKTQSEIARMFGISRPTLIKLLKDAKQEGIVNIEIRDTHQPDSLVRLERELCAFLSVRDVKIVPLEHRRVTIGTAAAEYLSDLLDSGMSIGIGRGATLGAAARAMKPRHSIEKLAIVALLGGIGSADSNNYTMFSNSICEIMSTAYPNSCIYPIYAPLIADTPEIANSFLGTRTVRDAFRKMKSLDLALVGAGGKEDYTSVIDGREDGLHFLQQLSSQRSVGNICSHFYDIHGNICHTDFDNRAIAVSAQLLRAVPAVICAAGGAAKVESIIGGARAGLYNILVTDEETARHILAKE